MRQLEQALNRRLFVRDTHTLALTSDGRSLLVHARIILDAHERAERLFDAPRLRGRVRLGTSDDLALGPLPDVLAAFGWRIPRSSWTSASASPASCTSCWTTTRWT